MASINWFWGTLEDSVELAIELRALLFFYIEGITFNLLIIIYYIYIFFSIFENRNIEASEIPHISVNL